MGIDVQLQTERGEVVAIALDLPETLSSFLPDWQDTSFCCLRFIDENGDATFNRLQMDAFLEEWERVRDKAQTEEQEWMWLAVKELAERCQSKVHSYLKFVGD